MKLRNVLGILGVAAVLVTPAIVTGCSQAKVTCLVGHAGAYPYILKFNNANVSMGDPMMCAQKGMLIGVETYHGLSGPNERDLNVNRVAIGTDDLPAIQASAACFAADDAAPPDGSGYKGGPYTDTAHTVYAIGDFVAGEPGADDFCPVASLTVAEQNIPKIPATTKANPAPTCAGVDMAGVPCDMMTTTNCCDVDSMMNIDPLHCYTPDQPATDTKYEWSNVKFYVTTDAPGTQMAGHVKFSDTISGCTAEYDFVGLWPAIGCAALDMDGNPTMMPDDTLCSPDPDLTKGRATGSGINPDFRTHCDPDLLYCVLDDGPIPILK